MASPWKHPNSGIYYFRRAVPEDLRPIMGKREIKTSLKTRDPHTAKSLFISEAAKTESEFQRARKQLQNATKKLTSLQEVSALAQHWEDRTTFKLYEKPDEVYEYLSMYDLSGDYVPTIDLMSEVSVDKATYRKSLFELLAPLIDTALLEAEYQRPESDSIIYKHLLSAFESAYGKVSNVALKILSGLSNLEEIKAPAPLKRHQANSGISVKLSEALTLWEKDFFSLHGKNRTSLKTVKSYKSHVTRFIDYAGDLAITDITVSVIREYGDLLLTLPSRPPKAIKQLPLPEQAAYAELEGVSRVQASTAENNLKSINVVLKTAFGLLDIDRESVVEKSGIFTRLKTKKKIQGKKTKDDEKDYTWSELMAIFQSPIYTEGWRPPRADYGDAFYWLPLIYAYTGARKEEIAQLMVRDLKPAEGHDFWYLVIQECEEHGQFVKNLNSIRKVPLHPDLIKLGFIEYAKSVPKKGRLFPKLHPNSDGFFGYNFGRRWEAYLKDTAKIKSEADPIHGFRHAFKTLARGAGINREYHERITGHSEGSKSVGDSYGRIELHALYNALTAFPSLARESGLITTS